MVQRGMCFVYLLHCANDVYYCGWTNDPVKRLKMHISGKGSKYVRAHLPAEMVYLEVFPDKHSAMSKEFDLKHKMSHAGKKEMISSDKNLLRDKTLQDLFG